MSARERGPRPLIVGQDVEVRMERKPPPAPPVRDFGLFLRENDQAVLGSMWPEMTAGLRGWDIGNMSWRGLERRDLGIASDPAGGYLKSSSQPTTAIQYLHAKLRCGQAGAETVNVGEFISIPKVTSPGTAYHLGGEGEPPLEAGMTLGAAATTMRTVGAFIDYSRLMKAVTGPLVGGVVARELLALLAAAVDKVSLCGTGVDGQATGIVNTPGVDVADGSTFAVAKATAMLRVVEDGNAEPTAWIMDPASAELLRKRPKTTGGEIMLLGDDGKMLGIPAYVTAGMDAGTIILGDFRELALLSRAIELAINPYIMSTDGKIRVTAFHFYDVVVRHPEVFAVATSVS